MSFTQSTWLKQYVDCNIRLRQAAQTAFEKDFFKLLVNAVFGKFLENLRNHITVRLVSESETIGAERLVAKSNFVSSFIINDSLTMLKMSRNKVLWTKPSAVGFSILDLSKLHMYSFHYNVMVPLFSNRTLIAFYRYRLVGL